MQMKVYVHVCVRMCAHMCVETEFFVLEMQ